MVLFSVPLKIYSVSNVIVSNFQSTLYLWIGNIDCCAETIFADQRFMVHYVIHQKCFAGLILWQIMKTTNIMGLKNVAPYTVPNSHTLMHMYMYIQ